MVTVVNFDLGLLDKLGDLFFDAMKLSSFESIVSALNGAGVCYLVVGGLAVNAHGYLRVTRDVDLVIRLEQDDIRAAFCALKNIGYLPSIPVSAEDFADPAQREAWRQEKNMLVLKFWSDIHPETPLDIFIYDPFDFETEYANALRSDHPEDVPASFISIPALIRMKEEAGRARDLDDIANLRKIMHLLSDDSNDA